MQIYSKLQYILAAFFLIAGGGYAYMTRLREPVGLVGMLFIAVMFLLVGFYLRGIRKHLGIRPEEVEDAPVTAEAGEQGFFPAKSWWPLLVSLAIWLAILGIVFSWWFFGVAVILALMSAAGWGLEFSLGKFKH